MQIIKTQEAFDKKVKWFGDRGRFSCDEVLFLCPIDATDVIISGNLLIRHRKNKIKGLTQIKRTVII